jgi:N6-adenosine-specific RNA methylase IME4
VAEIEVELDKITIGNRFRKVMGDIDSLAKNMSELGLLQAIGISEDNELIWGQRRLEAARINGWKTIRARVVNLDKLACEYSENTYREPFQPSEAVAIGAAMEAIESANAKERQVATIPEKGRKGFNVVENCPHTDKGKTRDKVGKAVGLSGKNYEKAKKVVATGNQEIIEEMDKTGNVDKAFKLVNRIEREKEYISTPLPEGKFDVLLADPPWTYDSDVSPARSLDNQYPQMADKEIVDMSNDVKDCTAENAILFLWVPQTLIKHGLTIMESWGFKYNTGMVWVKDRIGMGFYCRMRHELLLIGIKGKPVLPAPENRPDSVIESPRDKHSKKPKIHSIIQKMFPQRKYLELFGREKTDGWELWGNERNK